MNSLARNLVDRLMIKILHRNKNNNDIDDVEALVYLNEATREVHKWFAMYLPGHIRENFKYTTVAGESRVTLPTPAVIIQKLTVNGKHFIHAGPMVPEGRSRLVPDVYRLDSFNTVVFDHYRAALGDVIDIDYTPAEIKTLDIPSDTNPLVPGVTVDRSIFPQVLDDVLIMHAMISYEAARGMMQDTEQNLRNRWMTQIIGLFGDAIQPTSIGEYYQGYAPRGDTW